MRLAESVPADAPDLTLAEALAAAVDQHVVAGPQPWTVYVLGVYSEGPDVWMQIAPGDDGTGSIVLRLSRRATPAHALASLARTLPPPDRFPRILHVMRPL